MAELDGPRLAPKSGPARQLDRVRARLRRRRQRPDRDRPRLAGVPAECRVRLAACAAPVRAGADGARVVSAHVPRSGRALDRRQRGRARLRSVPRRRACASSVAAVRARAGRLLPGHHDVAACRLAPRGAAGRDRRLFGHAGARGRFGSRRLQAAGARPACRCCWCTASRTISFRCRRCSTPRRGSPRWKCRSNGTFPPASVTGSTTKACARAGIFSPAASAPRALLVKISDEA